jgi:predicted outer membrane protein
MAPLRSARRRPGTRTHRAALLLIAIIAGVGVLPGVAVAAPAGGRQLNAADMTLLNGVRLAGLWEMPAGQMAAEKGQSAKVREIGAGIAGEHQRLDELVVDAANKLGATIPSEPTAQQKGWLTEMKDASGARFDQIFVTRLRVAHGKIFPVIGAVRASTRDATVRKLCEDANAFVQHHMQMLESTGLVRWPELPPAALPAPGKDGLLAAAGANAGPQVGVSSTVVWLVFLAALGTGGIATYRMLRRS